MAGFQYNFSAEELQKEEWRSIIEYEGYYSISDLGRIRRDKAGPHTRVGYILSPQLGRSGYLKVMLNKLSKYKSFNIHRLVALAFLGPRPTGMVINHIDANKTNNRT